MINIRLILDDIRSAQNIGSIMRSADCLGVEFIYFCGYTPYPKTKNDKRLPHLANKIDRSIHKTALGAEKIINFETCDTTENAILDARKDGYFIAAVEQHKDSIMLNDFESPQKIALVLGNEVNGINPKILEKCDSVLEIPMFGKKESLNVSIACALAIFKLQFE